MCGKNALNHRWGKFPMMASIRITFSITVLLALSGCATLTNHETLRFKGLETTPTYFSGSLTLPEGDQAPVPVVVLVHGSAGVDDRYAFHRPALLEAGIGTFEVDFKTNVFTALIDRPPIATFQPWAAGAKSNSRPAMGYRRGP